MPVSAPGVELGMVVMRKASPRMYNVKVVEFDEESYQVSIVAQSWLQEVGRSKVSTLFKDECAQLLALHGYGLIKVCHRCIY